MGDELFRVVNVSGSVKTRIVRASTARNRGHKLYIGGLYRVIRNRPLTLPGSILDEHRNEIEGFIREGLLEIRTLDGKVVTSINNVSDHAGVASVEGEETFEETSEETPEEVAEEVPEEVAEHEEVPEEPVEEVPEEIEEPAAPVEEVPEEEPAKDLSSGIEEVDLSDVDLGESLDRLTGKSEKPKPKRRGRRRRS